MRKMSPNEIEEIEVQDKLNKCVDSFESFRFNAGAGAGKTYALVETIKHIIKNNLAELERKNQKVICITYTNVAVREIKERLGSSEIVLVSTIHDRLWELIRSYQPELIKLHLEKIKLEKIEVSNELQDESRAAIKKYAKLSDDAKSQFDAFVKAHRDVFYKNRGANAATIKAAYKDIPDKPECFSDLISNVGHFKDVLKRLYKLDRFQKCIEDIEAGKKSRVKYDSAFNSDRLEYMYFSHDTLLEYSDKLVDKYPVLRRVIVDKYSYFLIDEYQDTNEKVIKIFKNLHLDSKKNKQSWMVGYFGDTAQNIYDDGVGRHIKDLHKNIVDINKKFNRRSHKQIIDTVNVIRNDDIVQRPIFDRKDEGSVSFFYSQSNDDKKVLSERFLNHYRNDLMHNNKCESKNIHCLVLTNKLVSELSQFGIIHEVVKRSNIFYKDLKTKLLSNDLEKLHPTMLSLYRIVKLHLALSDEQSTYGQVFGKPKGDVTFERANNLLNNLKIFESSSLGGFISSLSEEIENEECEANLKLSILDHLGVRLNKEGGDYNLDSYIDDQVRELMVDSAMSDEDANKKVGELLKIDFSQWYSWVKFIDQNNEGKEIIFHTYHGTKGEEYENVAIIMEHNFGNRREGIDKFKKYFSSVGAIKEKDGSNVTKEVDENVDADFENSKNLLYVACSRAIKNLRILYVDDIMDIKNGVESIFGNVFEWESYTNDCSYV